MAGSTRRAVVALSTEHEAGGAATAEWREMVVACLRATASLAMLVAVAVGIDAELDWAPAAEAALAILVLAVGGAALWKAHRSLRRGQAPRHTMASPPPAVASAREVSAAPAAPQRRPSSGSRSCVSRRAARNTLAPTPRELEVLRLVAQGHTDREIAAALHVELRTVRTHLEHLSGKAGTHGRTALVSHARAAGWLD